MTAEDDAERARRFARERKARLGDSVKLQRETLDRVRRALEEAEARITAILEAQPSEFRLWQLGELQRQVRVELARITPAAEAALHEGAARAQVAGGALVDAPLAAAGIEIAADLVRLDPRKLDATRVFLTQKIRDITAEAATRISTELALTVTGVSTPDEAAGKVASILKDSSLKRARSIVRTEVGSAFSAAAQERQEQAARILPGLKKQWRRSGKLHSRFEHDAIDGQIQEVDQPFVLPGGVRLMFPRDPAAPVRERINCGCTSIPYMASWTVSRPGRQPVTDAERAGSRGKRIISDAFE